MSKIVFIAHDIRSAHNIGSILRTADGLGINNVYLTGFSPYPGQPEDARLPHEVAKVSNKIHKTALGAEKTLGIRHDDVFSLIEDLKKQGYIIVGLEQDPNSIKLADLSNDKSYAIILGREVEGLDKTILESCDVVVEIPMYGSKESFNVSVAAAIAGYHLTYLK